MKTTIKRFICLALIVMLVSSLTISVSAGSYYLTGTYNGSMYELSDYCDVERYSGMVICDSSEYLLKADVALYGSKYYDYVWHTNQLLLSVKGTLTPLISSTTGTHNLDVTKAVVEHYVDGHMVYKSSFLP